MSKEQEIDFIQCSHGKSRWSIVCKHLAYGYSTEWIPIPKPDGTGLNDWVCPVCYENWNEMIEQCKIDDFVPACIKCVDEIRRVFDRNYLENEKHEYT